MSIFIMVSKLGVASILTWLPGRSSTVIVIFALGRHSLQYLPDPIPEPAQARRFLVDNRGVLVLLMSTLEERIQLLFLLLERALEQAGLRFLAQPVHATHR
jgi:hypothetical protein